MYFVSKKLKKKYNITDERAALYDAAETWVDALKERPYLGMSNLHHNTDSSKEKKKSLCNTIVPTFLIGP